MRHPITDFYFKTKPTGDYWVRVDFPHPYDRSLRRGTIGEIYSLGSGTKNKRWIAVLSDGVELHGTFDTRKVAAEALLDAAQAIFVHGHPRYLFTETGIKEIN